MKIKAQHHAVVLASLFTVALIFCAAPVRAQLAQLTAVPNGTPAIGEEYNYLVNGLFVYSKTDLSLPGPGAIDVSRVYRSRDNTPVSGGQRHNNRAFGIGTRLSYDMFLYYVGLNSNGQYEWDVQMPDSSALVCTSTTNNYPFTCDNQPSGKWFNSYLDANSDVVRQDGTTYHFDSSGLLVSIKDHYTNLITITRGTNTGGHCTSAPSEYVSEVASSNERYVCFSYGDSNNPYDVTEIFDNAGIKKVNYTYDSSSRLKTVTQTNFNANAVTTYKYNQSTPSGAGDITEIDVNTECSNWGSCSTPGLVETFVTYLTAANSAIFLQSISSQVPGNGYQYSYTFDSSNTYVTKVVVTLPDSSDRKFHYDQAGYVTLDQRNPNQSAVSEEDTVFTRGSQKVGNSTEFIALVQEEDSNGYTWRESQYTYDTTTGDVLGVTLTPAPGQNDNNCQNGGGVSCLGSFAAWSYTYEPVGTGFNRLKSAVEPMAYGGVGTSYSYNDSPTSPSVTIEDPLDRGVLTTITGNSQGQPVLIQDPLGNPPTEITYDGTGNLKTVKDPAGNTTTYTPDADGRFIQVSSPLGRTTKYAYDALDDITDVYKDPNGLNLHTNYAYDLVGNLRSITTPDGYATNNPNAYTTTITRNATLTKTTVTDPLGDTTVTDLDGQGRKTDFTDQRGLETTYKYDLYGREITTVFNAKKIDNIQQETVNYGGFDALDRPISVSDSMSGTLSDTYDSLDSVLSESDSFAPYYSVTYGYDLNGRRISMQAKMNGTAQPTLNYGYDCDDELIGITSSGSGYSSPPNCSPSTSVTNGTTSTQAGINYDADGMPNWIVSDGIETTFTPRDADERVTNQEFSVPACSGSNGTLTYTYDDDGLLIGKGGCLAAVNLPPPTTSGATYNANDQIATWNGTAAGVDAASNITTDPASGDNIFWTARNQVSEINTSGGVANGYDANGRREFAAKTNDTDNLGFLHDGGAVAGWVDSYTGDLWNFLEIGGLPLAGSFTASGTTTNWVPLIDASGSTIALVNPAPPNSPPATTYTYDPSGTPTMSGSSNNYPFLYHGMEHEFVEPTNAYYYTGDGAYYSAQIMRSLSLTSAQGTSGPGGGPAPDRAHHHSHHGGAGGESRGAAINGHVNAAAIAQDGADPDPNGGEEITPQEAQQWFQQWADALEDILNFLTGGLFGGGGPSLPPNYYLFQQRLMDKRHELSAILGMKVLVTQGASAPGSRVIPQVTADGRILLYRAVKDPELSQISETGTFQTLPGISVEGKYFSLTPEEASSFGRQAYTRYPQEGPYTVVETSIPQDALAEIPIVDVDVGGISSVVIPEEMLPELADPEILLFLLIE